MSIWLKIVSVSIYLKECICLINHGTRFTFFGFFFFNFVHFMNMVRTPVKPKVNLYLSIFKYHSFFWHGAIARFSSVTIRCYDYWALWIFAIGTPCSKDNKNKILLKLLIKWFHTQVSLVLYLRIFKVCDNVCTYLFYIHRFKVYIKCEGFWHWFDYMVFYWIYVRYIIRG